jgi:hypothetical protein
VALALDGLEGKMRHINIIMGMDLTHWATSTEEILELGIPVMFIFGTIKVTMEENITRFKFIYRRRMPETQPLYRHKT